MKKGRLFTLLTLLLAAMFVLAACSSEEEATDAPPEPTDAPAATDAPPEPTDEPKPELGSAERPIKMLFVPSVNVDFMIASGDLIEQALEDATGLVFDVSVPTSYAATIEEMCASPEDTIGFIPAMGYALASQLCGVQPGLAADRFGWPIYWSQIIVRRDSGIESLADLNGKTWGFGTTTSGSGYLVPGAFFAANDITVGDKIETGGHTATAQAVYNGDVDFGTTYFSPPLIPDSRWEVGMDPDIPDELIPECAVTEEGKLYCGGWRVLDARANILEGSPDVIQMVDILTLTFELPNDTMSFSPDFPEELKQVIMDAIIAYVQTEACLETLCNQENHYGWTGAALIYDENFDGMRIMMEAQGISLENIGK